MKKSLLLIPLFFASYLTTFVSVVNAQTPCGIARPGVECINPDGTIRPGEEPGGGSGNEEEPGGGDGKPMYCSNITEDDKSTVIPCGTKYHICNDEENAECEFKHLFQLVNNMTRNFITFIFAPLLTIILMYIGFLFIKDQAGAKVKAKQLLWRLLVGTFFVLGAWLIVNFILSALNARSDIQSTLENN